MDWARHRADWPMAEASRFVISAPHRWHVQILGSGPDLMLIHGAGGASQSWRHLAPRLGQFYRVIMMDLPGQGFSRSGGVRRFGLDEMAADLSRLMRSEGWRPVALIGHSAGAAVALRMAEEMDPAPPVVGINAALGNFKGLAGVLFPVMAKVLAALPFVANAFTASAGNPRSVARLIEGTGSRLPEEDMRHYRALVGDPAHVQGTLSMMAQWSLDPLLARLPQHPSRCLLITGENDRAVPPGTSATLAARMPECTHVALPGLGHLAHEEDAEAVLRRILEFLGRQHGS